MARLTGEAGRERARKGLERSAGCFLGESEIALKEEMSDGVRGVFASLRERKRDGVFGLLAIVDDDHKKQARHALTSQSRVKLQHITWTLLCYSAPSEYQSRICSASKAWVSSYTYPY